MAEWEQYMWCAPFYDQQLSLSNEQSFRCGVVTRAAARSADCIYFCPRFFFINLVRMFDWAVCGIRAFTKHSLLCWP